MYFPGGGRRRFARREFVVKQLSHLADKDSEYFENCSIRKRPIFSAHRRMKELSDLKKKKAQLETAIANQGEKNLREADDSLKRFIQEDVKMTDELFRSSKTLLQN